MAREETFGYCGKMGESLPLSEAQLRRDPARSPCDEYSACAECLGDGMSWAGLIPVSPKLESD